MLESKFWHLNSLECGTIYMVFTWKISVLDLMQAWQYQACLENLGNAILSEFQFATV